MWKISRNTLSFNFYNKKNSLAEGNFVNISLSQNLSKPMRHSSHESQQTFVLLKTSWRRPLSSSSEYVFKMSLRRFDQDKYIRLSQKYWEEVFKTSSRRLDQNQYIRLDHTSSRSLQDIFKTSYQDVFKMSLKCLQDVLQKRLQDIFKTPCKDIFKTFSRGIIKLNSSC